MVAKSNTDNNEPNRATPKTNNELPNRPKLRNNSDDPNDPQFSTDKVLPKLVKSYIVTVEPNRE